jgi:hypothetical protein
MGKMNVLLKMMDNFNPITSDCVFCVNAGELHVAENQLFVEEFV